MKVRRRLQRYLRSVLIGVEWRTGWQMAEAMGEATPDGVQRLWTTARWDTDGMRDDLRSVVVEHLGDAAGVAVIDETGCSRTFIWPGHTGVVAIKHALCRAIGANACAATQPAGSLTPLESAA